MEKKTKIIIFLLILVIVVPIAYFAISGYLHDLEEKTFYNGIKEISDIENKSDAEGDVISKKKPQHLLKRLRKIISKILTLLQQKF